MDPFVLTAAYKYVALVLMLAEANFFAERVGLKLEHPICEQDVRAGSHVGPAKTNDFTGSIVADDYLFGFGRGRLANFKRGDFRADSAAAVRERNAKLAGQASLVDTNGAYELATNWLARIGVDTEEVRKKYKLTITQWRYAPERLSQPVLLPVYQVEWRGNPFKTPRRAAEVGIVTVTVLGTTKELVELHVLDDTLFARAPIRIASQERLLSITDADFRGFDALQRSNLVHECGVRAGATAPGAAKPTE